ncbi:hypothetical protein CR51_14810 [Caballeronia megalochromosomata]|nr:hypothetical protein CR51_14810 [Caballeronia megalochromosomata]
MTDNRDHFILLWRAIVAYPIAMASGAAAFFPILLMGAAAKGGNMVRAFPHTEVVRDALGFIQVELGAVIACFIFFGLPLLPLYAFGIFIAHKFHLRSWIYYASLGSSLSVWAWARPYVYRSGETLHWSAPTFLIFIEIVVGAVGGVVCWAFLRVTLPKSSA